MTSAACPAVFGVLKCKLALGHAGQHKAGAQNEIRWGGRYSRVDLSGKPGAIRDAARDQAARRRPRTGPQCKCCLRAGTSLNNGVCAGEYIASRESHPAATARVGDAVTLAEQTAARLERAGITWDDPGLALIAEHNREAALRAELAALKAGRPAPSDDCGWKSCPAHWWLRYQAG